MRRGVAANRSLTRTSRNRYEERWPLSDERVEAANRLLTRAAPNLVSEFSATFDKNLTPQVLTVAAPILALAFSATFDTNLMMDPRQDGLVNRGDRAATRFQRQESWTGGAGAVLLG